jgi:uncharacterized membrane protein YbhN (UPF0104 family)
LGGALLVLGLPKVAGANWTAIGGELGGLGVADIALLSAVWLAGLWVHTVALAAALPGLSHRRAFFLNITGSAVSNLLPLGGTAGSVVNYWATRAWGFSTSEFVRWAILTNIWDVLGRLMVPGVAVVWLTIDGSPSGVLWDTGVGASLVLLVGLALTVAALRTETWARFAGAALDRIGPVVRRPPPPGTRYAELAVLAQRAVSRLVSTAWRQLTVGKAGYAALQTLLLWLCLDLVHVSPPAAVVFGAFALERVLSLAVLSPAATGIVELGLTAYLSSAGADPGAAAAGVLLYRIFVVGLEVPVGGLLLMWWFGRRLRGRHDGRRLRAAAPPAPVVVDELLDGTKGPDPLTQVRR